MRTLPLHILRYQCGYCEKKKTVGQGKLLLTDLSLHLKILLRGQGAALRPGLHAF